MANLVLTPGGYKPSELVHHVPTGHILQMRENKIVLARSNGELVREFESIERKVSRTPLMPANLSKLAGPPARPLSSDLLQRPGGNFLGRLPPKPRMRVRANSTVLEAPQVVPFPVVDGWIVYSGWTNNSGQPISRFATTWVVPPAPETEGDQTIFLFNGIQNSTMIYQPVLQWGPSAAGGGKRWSIASWYADGQTGPSFHTDLIDVNVGDTLVGIMTLTGHNGAKFDYSCEFHGIANTTLPISQVEELTWANETLEAYGVTDCSQYPATSKTVMRSIAISTGTATPNLSWTVNDAHTECGGHTKIISNSNTDGNVELWYRGEYGEGGWEARHGLTGQQYQAKFDDLVGNQGMQLICVSGYADGNDARYAAIWRKNAAHPAWLARHGLSSAQHQQLFADLPPQGYTPVLVNGYTVNGHDLYASIWHKLPNGPAWAARHGLSAAQYQQAFDDLTHQGYMPVWVSGYGGGGDPRFAAVWHKKPNQPAWAARHGLTSADYQQTFDQLTAQGYRPVVVSGYGVNGSARYAAIFVKDNPPAWQARHGLTPSQYQQLYADLPPQGYRPEQVNGYAVGSNTRFTSLWEK
ncbi:hypothetical protein LMIY3S_01951 [Labrys miyagiensis]